MGRKGFIKLYRKIFDSDLWPNMNAFRVFIYLLGHAAWETTKTSARYQSVILQPGDVLTGHDRLAKDCDLTVRQIRVAIVCLKRTSRITTRTTNRYSVISIVNWATYQGGVTQDDMREYPCNDKRSSKQVTSRRQADDSIEEVNIRREEEGLIPSADADYTLPVILRDKGNGIPPLITIGRKTKKEYPQAALDVYQAYAENIVAIPAKKADALRNIAARIKEGYTPAQLTGAVERYFEERQGNPDAMPYHANNFFGQKAYFLGYLPDPGPGCAEAAHV